MAQKFVPLDPDLKLEDYDRLEEAAEIGYREAIARLDASPTFRPDA